MLNVTELTCRVCLQEKEVLINIYDKLEDLHTTLSILLQICVGLQIDEDDTFPKYLCEDCTRELLITSKFREKCDKSQQILGELLENIKIIEQEELTNDIIEYCSEDENGAGLNDFIILDPAIGHENHQMAVPNEVSHFEPSCQFSLLKKNSAESTKNTELPNQPLLEGVVEESILTKDYSNQLQLEIVESPATVDESCTNTSIALNDPKFNYFFTKACSEEPEKSHIFKCDICGAIFKQAMNLQKHLQKSHGPVQCFVCYRCHHCFSLETEFHKHLENCRYLKTTTEENFCNKNREGTTEETEYCRKCIYCERDFPTPFALRMHLRTHTGERPFQCVYCTKSFKTRSQLGVHHKRHVGQADFVCGICNKSFYEQSNLTVHMRTHTGERPHICIICKKTFARVFLLQFHMRTHTGEKPFKCNFCDKSFRQHTDLRNHLTIHSGKKQHACDLCGKSYIKRSHLVQHMSKHQIKVGTVKFEEDHGTAELNVAACENNFKNPMFPSFVEREDNVV